MKKEKPPKHLSKESKKFWKQIAKQYVLEDHHLKLLQSCCECWDRILDARAEIEKKGPYYTDRFGQPKEHPGHKTERENKALFGRLLKQLGLDIEQRPDLPKMHRIY